MDNCINLKRVDPYAKSQLAGYKNPYGDHVNLEPLFINTVGSHRFRPKADFGFDNFFLASDYVRTYTDLATMEGANEAARRAVNALLEHDGSSAPRAHVWPLNQPWYVRARGRRWTPGFSAAACPIFFRPPRCGDSPEISRSLPSLLSLPRLLRRRARTCKPRAAARSWTRWPAISRVTPASRSSGVWARAAWAWSMRRKTPSATCGSR